jgi:hypothetical protein
MMGHAVRANHLEDPIALLVVDPHVALSTHGLCRGKRLSLPPVKARAVLSRDPAGGAVRHGSLDEGLLG